MNIYIYIYIYIYICPASPLARARVKEEQRRANERGPHPEGENISRSCLDLSVRTVLNAFPCEVSLRSELRSPNISEKTSVLQPPPGSAHRVPPIGI